MNYPSKIRAVIVLIIGVLLNIPGVGLTQEAKISFNRDVRPILASKCFACHGPDENHQEAGLRLDLRSAALDHGVLSPGDPGNSEVISRIESEEA